MGRSNREKGIRKERELCNIIRGLTGLDLKRNLDQNREGGYDIKGIDQFAIEVKSRSTIVDSDITKFWKQAVDQAEIHEKLPLLAIKPDRQSWKIYMHDGELFPLNDVRGCICMSIELFCAFIINEFSESLLSNKKHIIN